MTAISRVVDIKVQRLLPAERREYQYHVKHTITRYEWGAMEVQPTLISSLFSRADLAVPLSGD